MSGPEPPHLISVYSVDAMLSSARVGRLPQIEMYGKAVVVISLEYQHTTYI